MSETVCAVCGNPLYVRPRDTWLTAHGGAPFICTNPECTEYLPIPVQEHIRQSLSWPFMGVVAVCFFAFLGFFVTLRHIAHWLFGLTL
jgi:hypothetical protein